jgi:hypothetical protein
MKLQSSAIRNSLFALALILGFPAFRAAAQSKPDNAAAAQVAAIPARITQAIDETQLVRLPGNVHPLARKEFDQGLVSDAALMKRMMLVLERSPEQQAALSAFMDQQLSKDSANYHRWLSPQEFGKVYGPADADIQAVTDWLTRQGFGEIKVGAGRTAIEFSGNVGQVQNAFHTEIHQYRVAGEARQANASDPQIPAALAPVVGGVLTLHNFPRKSMRRVSGAFTRTADGRMIPQFTGTGGNFYAVGPADFAKIYNIPATLDGTGQTIAIVANSNINPQDVTDFRTLFGLPVNPPNIIVNGPDPGISGPAGTETEADVDVEVSGMVAPKATIDFVVSEDTLTSAGTDLSAFYIIDNNLAPVMSESFGACEASLGTTGNQFYNSLWEQAAAEGITVFVSAGDGGSAGCDDFNTATVATLGLAVSGIASTPFNVAVGGTDFDDFTTQTTFWSATNSADGKRESALGYIPEIPWNDSCAATATSATLNTVCAGAAATNIVGGSGGPSSLYAKPTWQSGITPNGIAAGDNHRYTPDASLFASDGLQSKSFYLICEADAITPGGSPSCASSGSFSFLSVGGTSASSPAFASIMALINQNNGRQGNANPVLYRIAATSGQSCNSSTTPLTGSTTCSFYDITKGNDSVPCAGGSANCSSTTSGTNGVLVTPASATTPAWTTATGYDLATGLGSVNVANLATQWPLAVGNFHLTTTALTLNGGTSAVTITHGTAVTANVTVTSTSGTPTGDVSLLAPTTVNGDISNSTLSGGTVAITGVILPGGSYNVNARYAGDTLFASSASTPGVPVIVGKENSRLQYGIVTFSPTTGGIVNTNATSVVYGSSYILRMDILNSTSNACQVLVTPTTATGCAFDATGTVTITDNGSPLDTGTFNINSAGSAEDQPIQLTGGAHALSATYSGDISYNAVTVPVTDSVTVSQAATTTALASSASTVAAGTNVTLTATMSSASNSTAGTTGTVTFFNGATPIGSPVAVTPVPALGTSSGAGGTAALTTSFATIGTASITATYNGDTNYTLSSAPAITVTVTSSGAFTLAGAAATVTAGSSGNSAITLTPTGGFTGSVAITCGATLPGVSCSPLSVTVPSGGANATGQLAINVSAPSTSMTAMNLSAPQTFLAAKLPAPSNGKTGWWTLSGGTGLAAILLLLLPGRKRYRAALGLGLVCIFSFTLGCGGGSGGGGGPTATVTHLTVSSTKLAASGTLTVTATVTGGTPAGNVQFFVDGTAAGAAVPVSGGTTGNIMLTAASAPPLFNLIGTHMLSAQYQGDANTLASQSMALNITVTGTTQLPISANPASSNTSATISLTIN